MNKRASTQVTISWLLDISNPEVAAEHLMEQARQDLTGFVESLLRRGYVPHAADVSYFCDNCAKIRIHGHPHICRLGADYNPLDTARDVLGESPIPREVE